jgi:tellurite resistance protein
VRDLRKKNREDQKRIRELEAKLASQNPQPTLSKKPILEDFDYDTEKYESALSDWFDKKKGYDAQLEAQRRAEEEQTQSWQNKLEGYAQARTSLKVKDFEDAESTVAEMLNVTQQGVVIQGAENPALVIYALGKNPKKAKELASIADPVKFAFAIAKLETQLKVTGKRTPPPPEKTVGGGTAPIRGAVDSNLERLREDAARTGDYSKVYAYKKQKRA